MRALAAIQDREDAVDGAEGLAGADAVLELVDMTTVEQVAALAVAVGVVLVGAWVQRAMGRRLEPRLLGPSRAEPAGRQLTPFDLLGVLFAYGAGMLALPAAYMAVRERSVDFDLDALRNLPVEEQLALTAIVHAFPAIFAVIPAIRGAATRRALGFGGRRGPLVAPYAGLRYLAYLPVMFGLGWINLVLFVWATGEPPTQEIAKQIQEGLSDPSAWLFLFAVLLVPWIEEVLFRGFLLRFLQERMGALAGVVLSSLAFALLHGMEAALPIFGLACLLAILRLRTGSLFAPWLVHAMHNGLQTAFLSAGIEP